MYIKGLDMKNKLYNTKLNRNVRYSKTSYLQIRIHTQGLLDRPTAPFFYQGSNTSSCTLNLAKLKLKLMI
jgi:hypothetical protein